MGSCIPADSSMVDRLVVEDKLVRLAGLGMLECLGKWDFADCYCMGSLRRLPVRKNCKLLILH